MNGSTIRNNWLTFGGDPLPDTDSVLLLHFPHNVEYGFLGDLFAFRIQSLADFDDTRRNDWCQQDNESTTFWERSARHPDLNLDSNVGSLLVEILALAEVCTVWALSGVELVPTVAVHAVTCIILVTTAFCCHLMTSGSSGWCQRRIFFSSS